MSPEAIASSEEVPQFERPQMDVDIACVGFGPAMGGFLTTLTRELSEHPEDPAFSSKVAPGMPLQVMCYERADDISAGVSGVVTRARGIRTTFPGLNPAEIPMAAEVTEERVLYLLDPVGASRRSLPLRAGDAILHLLDKWVVRLEDHAFELPWAPGFLHKSGGLVMSMGQFNQWVGSQIMASGLAQIWPGMPVSEPIFSGAGLKGVRLTDQGVDATGAPVEGFMPGMDVCAPLTVVGDGPVGAVGQALDRKLGMPAGHALSDWALGMKMVIELPADSPLQPGTVWHTFGYPEPEIFGFLYVHPDHLASVGIFVPSWMHETSQTSYRYLQHYIQHPALWRYLKDGTLRSWGAKSLQESGQHGEPFLTGDGFARIGEGSGSTNMLTGSGVDEAWTTGTQLADAVIELLRANKPFSHENLAATYETRRRASWVEHNAQEAKDARNGFHKGMVRGMVGMALAGMTHGRLALGQTPSSRRPVDPHSSNAQPIIDGAKQWPDFEYDGRLLVSHQDVLLMGGKVQAMPGFADHVAFRDREFCKECADKKCVAMCSGQAITRDADGNIAFEREKCVHCGACLWNCAHAPDGVGGNIEFRAGAGGLHSAEN